MWTSDGNVRKACQRFDEAGDAHELTFSCHQKLPLLGKDRTRQWFVEALARARDLQDFDLWAYVIMPDHAHVLLRPRRDAYAIADILKAIKQSVSRRAMIYLREHAPEWMDRLAVRWPDGRVEHRFWQQGGGYDRNVRKVDTAWKVIDYLHNNPVRAGLVRAAVDWRWSSARCYVGLPDVVIEMDRPPL